MVFLVDLVLNLVQYVFVLNFSFCNVSGKRMSVNFVIVEFNFGTAGSGKCFQHNSAFRGVPI